MAPALSVNLNKIALVRNAREHGTPDLMHLAQVCLDAGCHGLTVHPRPDRRHIRPDDVRDIAELLRGRHEEFNVEGNPFEGPRDDNDFPGYMALVTETCPDQCTLVPDQPDQLTSDHGWDLEAHADRLEPIVRRLRAQGSRVSVFVDPDPAGLEIAATLGIERIELYTGPYAEDWARGELEARLEPYIATAQRARELGLGLNAGHDLNLKNLPALVRAIGDLDEVSIGQALIADALELGLYNTIAAYLRAVGH